MEVLNSTHFTKTCGGNHAGRKKCSGHRAFTRRNEFRKLLVPFSMWYFGIGVQPVLQRVEIINRNSTFTKAIDEMFHEVGRRLPNFRHSGTVCGTRSFEAVKNQQIRERSSIKSGERKEKSDLSACQELTSSIASKRSLTVAALNAHRSRDRQGAFGTVIAEVLITNPGFSNPQRQAARSCGRPSEDSGADCGAPARRIARNSQSRCCGHPRPSRFRCASADKDSSRDTGGSRG